MADISNYNLELDKDTCIQCGQCALVCPVGARYLVARPEEERLALAEDMLGDYVQKSINRLRKGIIVDTVD